jgi:hypothetical protein
MKLIFFSLLIFISGDLNAQLLIRQPRDTTPTKYFIEIDPIHHQFNFLQTFNIQPISSTTADAVVIKHTQSIHLNDSSNNIINALENEINNAVFHRISRDSLTNDNWELVSVRVFANYYPCCSESWGFNEVHFINPNSTSFSSSYISDLISKSQCEISTNGQFLLISRYYGYIMNNGEEGGATYIFKKNKGH